MAPHGTVHDEDIGVTDEFEQSITALGFEPSQSSRRGGRVWHLAFNRHLTFSLHDSEASAVVLSWALSLGEYIEERDWRLSVTDTSAAELYPQRDVRISRDIEAVGAEISRVLITLRFDLGDPRL